MEVATCSSPFAAASAHVDAQRRAQEPNLSSMYSSDDASLDIGEASADARIDSDESVDEKNGCSPQGLPGSTHARGADANVSCAKRWT